MHRRRGIRMKESRMRRAVQSLVLAAVLLALPSLAWSQSLTGTGNQTVALLDNTHRLFADKPHRQVDMRFAKIFRMRGTCADVGVDLYNIFNVNTPTIYDGTYDAPPAVAGGQGLQPTGIVQPRFARST
jgi:hypothetical protein